MKRLYLSQHDKKLGGVCGGLAEFFGLDSTIVRVLFALFFLFGGSGLLVYVVLWVLVPKQPIMM